MLANLKRVLWWVVKVVCGVVTGMGAILAIGGVAFLVPLTAGWVQPDHDIPPVRGAAAMLAIGLVQMIVGFKLPAWLDIDRLL